MTGPSFDAEQPASSRANLTVAAVARRLGVAPATLRTWDRRYGLGPSEHQAGSHRRYSAADVARLLVMRRLTLEGVAPAEAAAIARDTATDVEGASVTVLTGAGRTRPSERRRAPESTRGPSVVRLPTPAQAPAVGSDTEGEGASRAVRGLVRAATLLDPDECRRIIRRHVERDGTVTTWESLVAPALAQVGERWSATGDGVEVEHLLSECVIDAMRAVAVSVRPLGTARPVLLAAAEEEQHGLPLHVLAGALAEEGVAVRLLGVRVPREALAAAVRRIGPAVVVVYAHLPVPDAGGVTDLPRQRPAPLVLLGGPGWDGVAVPAGAERVGGLRASVERVERAVGR